MLFRKTLFWIHLIAGVIAAIVIAIMSFTGVPLAFEEELVAWAERDVRMVTVPPSTPRLSLETMRQRVMQQVPNLKSLSVTVRNEPEAAVAFSSGREGTWYVNPYTGEVKKPQTRRMRTFMTTMMVWHRWLGMTDKHTAIGGAITGACNAAFVVLALTGIYLWWPRKWSWKAVKALVVPSLTLRGKGRDFNWHNSLGLWTTPILVVLTVTALPISYRWANNLIYRMVGEPLPTYGPQAPQLFTPATPEAPTLTADAALQIAQQAFPRWEQISVRPGEVRKGPQPTPPGIPPLTVSVRTTDAWPRVSSTTLTLQPYTGDVVKQAAFSDMSLGRRIRFWSRFLHTGQAVGWWGQLLAGLASLFALVLVYTGVALTYRRFFRRPART